MALRWHGQTAWGGVIMDSLETGQILDSRFNLSEAAGATSFFSRMANALPQTMPAAATTPLHIRVSEVSRHELLDSVTRWDHWGYFHRSSNYPHWNLRGLVDHGQIALPAQGLLFQHHAQRSMLEVFIDPQTARRGAELTYHAARNLALWRRGLQYAPMLHASAVIFEGKAWLLLGEKGAGKSTLFIEAILRHGAEPLSNDRVVLDTQSQATVWPWPSYISYCEGTVIDYPELRRVFLAASRVPGHDHRSGFYRGSYTQSHKRIAPPFLLSEVLKRPYEASGELGGIIRARMTPGCSGGLRIKSVASTAALTPEGIQGVLFGREDPDFPCWHDDVGPAMAGAADTLDHTLGWMRQADVPLVDIDFDPVLGKPKLSQVFVR